MKKLKTFLKFTPVLLLPFANVTSATTVPVVITFETLPEIVIDETQVMTFGNILTLGSGDTCDMLVGIAANTLPNADELTVAADLVSSGAAAADSAAGAVNVASDCVSSTQLTPGIYTVTSFGGAGMDITVAAGSSTGGEITFEPSGYAVSYGNSGADDTSRVALDSSASQSIDAPFAADSNIVVQEGVSIIALGGEITNNQALSRDTTLDLTFELNVVYN